MEAKTSGQIGHDEIFFCRNANQKDAHSCQDNEHDRQPKQDESNTCWICQEELPSEVALLRHYENHMIKTVSEDDWTIMINWKLKRLDRLVMMRSFFCRNSNQKVPRTFCVFVFILFNNWAATFVIPGYLWLNTSVLVEGSKRVNRLSRPKVTPVEVMSPKPELSCLKCQVMSPDFISEVHRETKLILVK